MRLFAAALLSLGLWNCEVVGCRILDEREAAAGCKILAEREVVPLLGQLKAVT